MEASTIEEALATCAAHPDVHLVLLDPALRAEYGLDALRRLREAAPEAAVVVVSGSEDVATIHACIEAGAMSFIPKSPPPDVLTEAMRHVLAGSVWLPEQVQALEAAGAPARPVLTPRQLDVMRCLNRGLPTKSISRELDLSENTVKEHVASIFRALGVVNRTQAVIKASRLGLGANA